jgi:hypothetical protein
MVTWAIHTGVGLITVLLVKWLGFPDWGKPPWLYAVFSRDELDGATLERLRESHRLVEDEEVVALCVRRRRGREDDHVLLTDRRLTVEAGGERTAVPLRDIRGWTEPPADREVTGYLFTYGEGPRHPTLRFEVVGEENRATLDRALWPLIRPARTPLRDLPDLD